VDKHWQALIRSFAAVRPSFNERHDPLITLPTKQS